MSDPEPTGERQRHVLSVDHAKLYALWNHYLESPVYEERALCGMYDELANRLESMGSKALGNLDCPGDFGRFQPSRSSNIEYKDEQGYEFRTLIMGEIAGSAHGTVLRAIGNYYSPSEVIIVLF
jgi:hypothetical protein